MKKVNQCTPSKNKTEIAQEGFLLEVRQRPSSVLALTIPNDALKSLQVVAESRDMSVEALIKFYVGQSLRQDLAKLAADRVLEKTAQVLHRHLQSKDEISAILQEIQAATIAKETVQ